MTTTERRAWAIEARACADRAARRARIAGWLALVAVVCAVLNVGIVLWVVLS